MTQQTTWLQKARTSPLDSGVFTWDIATDRFFADGAFALLFGLDPNKTMVGLPMERYMHRVHPDDAPRVARSIHNAIVQGLPCQQNYRVQNLSGQYSEIMAFGRCFRDPDGIPSQYAGIIYPAFPPSSHSNDLQELCSQAHRVAVRNGRLDIAGTMRKVLDELFDTRQVKEYAH